MSNEKKIVLRGKKCFEIRKKKYVGKYRKIGEKQFFSMTGLMPKYY